MIHKYALNITQNNREAAALLPFIQPDQSMYFYDYAVGPDTVTVVTDDDLEARGPGYGFYVAVQVEEYAQARGQGMSVAAELLGPTNPVVLGIAIRLGRNALEHPLPPL